MLRAFFFLTILFIPTISGWPQTSSSPDLIDSLQANLFVEKANKLRDNGQFNAARLYLDSAMVIRQKIGDKSGIANVYGGLATLHKVKGNREKAIEQILKALEIHEEIKDPEGTAIDQNFLAAIYMQQKDTVLALENLHSALDFFENRPDSNSIYNAATILFNLSTVYNQLNNPHKALTFAEKGAVLNRKINNELGLAHALHSSGLALFSLNELDEAAVNFQISLEKAKQIEHISLIANNQLKLSQVFLKQRKISKAINNATSAIDLFESIGSEGDLKNAYLNLSDIYEVSKDYKKAFENYRRFHIKYDSLHNSESMRWREELLTRYETQKKEAENVLLKKEKRLQGIELKKQKFQILSFAIGAFFLAILAAGLIYYSRQIRLAKDQIAVEKDRSENLLLNILPVKVASELKEKGAYEPRSHYGVSILFADIIGFTHHAENLPPAKLVKDLDEYFSAFDKLTEKHGVEKIKTIGDAYMAAGGLKGNPVKSAKNVVSMGLAFHETVKKINEKRALLKQEPYNIRIGIHTGSVTAGIVGSRKFAYDIWGDAVNVAARLESTSEAGQVNISQGTFELIKPFFKVQHRGKIVAKNKGEIDMYFVDEPINNLI